MNKLATQGHFRAFNIAHASITSNPVPVSLYLFINLYLVPVADSLGALRSGIHLSAGLRCAPNCPYRIDQWPFRRTIISLYFLCAAIWCPLLLSGLRLSGYRIILPA